MSRKRRDRESLGDMLEAMKIIGVYIKGMTYREFQDDRKTQDAVVRNFEVIGEAAKNITPLLRAQYPEIPWKKLAGLRDKLIHFYFGIDYKIVWDISRKELPKLRKQVNAVLERDGS